MFGSVSIEYDQIKSEKLKSERGISFEEIIPMLDSAHILDITDHPNRDRYLNQRICVLNIDGYVYMVPFVERANTVFLKTIIPSRKATAHYLRKGED
ncbi:MAG: BrnT family toxin [Myxococcaceae bacterium]